MGTEFLIIFLPVPAIFWAWNIWQIIRPQTRKKGIILLLLGVALVAYMVLPITTKQYFIQGLMFSGLVYIPFYIVAWLAVTGGLIEINRRHANKNT